MSISAGCCGSYDFAGFCIYYEHVVCELLQVIANMFANTTSGILEMRFHRALGYGLQVTVVVDF
jgi:hypothetical protein